MPQRIRRFIKRVFKRLNKVWVYRPEEKSLTCVVVLGRRPFLEFNHLQLDLLLLSQKYMQSNAVDQVQKTEDVVVTTNPMNLHVVGSRIVRSVEVTFMSILLTNAVTVLNEEEKWIGIGK